MTTSPFGSLLRDWRSRRGLTQLALANMIGSTARHISFIETGRSRPGRDLVLRIADGLTMPHRECNQLLAAAGFAPEFAERPIDHGDLEPYRRAVEAVLDRHEPYPACVLDRWGAVVLANRSCQRLNPGIEDLSAEEVIDAVLGPGPQRDRIVNWGEVAWSYLDRLERSASANPDERLRALAQRARAHLQGEARPTGRHGTAAVQVRMQIGDRQLTTFTTVMRFENADDITLGELAVELIFPLDQATAEFFESLPGLG